MTEKPHGSAANQRELGRLEKWVDVNFMKFSKGRCQVLYLERKNPMHRCRLRAGRLEHSLPEKILKVLGDTQLSQQSWKVMKKAASLLGCVRKTALLGSVSSRLRVVIPPPYSVLVRHCCGPGSSSKLPA